MSQRSIIQGLGRDPNGNLFSVNIVALGGPGTKLYKKSSEFGPPTRRFLGAPNLRTTWEVQNVTLSLALLLRNANINVSATNAYFLIKLVVQNRPITVDKIKIKFPEGVNKTEQVIKEHISVYVLELFSTILLSQGETLELEIELEQEGSTVISNETFSGGIEVRCEEAEIEIIYDQEFEPTKHAQLRS
jgi:hypothetical protein